MPADWKRLPCAMLFSLAAGASWAADDPCLDSVAETPPGALASESAGRSSDPVGGMGGTGIFAELQAGGQGQLAGTITWFGSICVNGRRVAYDSDTPTERDGQRADARDLHLGQVVRLAVEQSADGLRARRIALLSSVAGIVTARDEAAREFKVLGQPVVLAGDAWIALSGTAVPAVGTPVRVSGLITPSGAVLASRLESMAVDERAVIMARINELDGRHAAVGAVRVEFPATEATRGLGIGQEVAVRGRWDGEALQAESVEVAPRHARDVAAASVEGYLHACSGSRALGLDGMELRFDSAELPPPAWLGQRVIIEGRALGDGVLEVRRILRRTAGADASGPTEPLPCTAHPAPQG